VAGDGTQDPLWQSVATRALSALLFWLTIGTSIRKGSVVHCLFAFLKLLRLLKFYGATRRILTDDLSITNLAKKFRLVSLSFVALIKVNKSGVRCFAQIVQFFLVWVIWRTIGTLERAHPSIS
jgi:hypothetical protein